MEDKAMRAYAALVVAALLFFGAAARASDVSGQAMLAGRGPAGEAVIYLDGEKKAAPMAKAVVDQRDKTFIPHISVITVGTTVQFPNNDTVFHNVFAYFQAK